MRLKLNRVVSIALFAALAGAVACESEKKKEESAAAATPTPTPAPTPTPEPEEKKPSRPEKIETEVTDARRAKVEGAIAEAKGFLIATDIENKLKANKAVDQKGKAVKTFDASANGKWVLFAGPISNMTDTGFDLGITYTPQLPNDPMGMSRQWFPVTFSEIEGYEKDKFEAGNMVVVLAKYNGDQKGSPGHELVEAGHWE